MHFQTQLAIAHVKSIFLANKSKLEKVSNARSKLRRAFLFHVLNIDGRASHGDFLFTQILQGYCEFVSPDQSSGLPRYEYLEHCAQVLQLLRVHLPDTCLGQASQRKADGITRALLVSAFLLLIFVSIVREACPGLLALTEAQTRILGLLRGQDRALIDEQWGKIRELCRILSLLQECALRGTKEKFLLAGCMCIGLTRLDVISASNDKAGAFVAACRDLYDRIVGTEEPLLSLPRSSSMGAGEPTPKDYEDLHLLFNPQPSHSINSNHLANSNNHHAICTASPSGNCHANSNVNANNVVRYHSHVGHGANGNMRSLLQAAAASAERGELGSRLSQSNAEEGRSPVSADSVDSSNVGILSHDTCSSVPSAESQSTVSSGRGGRKRQRANAPISDNDPSAPRRRGRKKATPPAAMRPEAPLTANSSSSSQISSLVGQNAVIVTENNFSTFLSRCADTGSNPLGDHLDLFLADDC